MALRSLELQKKVTEWIRQWIVQTWEDVQVNLIRNSHFAFLAKFWLNPHVFVAPSQTRRVLKGLKSGNTCSHPQNLRPFSLSTRTPTSLYPYLVTTPSPLITRLFLFLVHHVHFIFTRMESPYGAHLRILKCIAPSSRPTWKEVDDLVIDFSP